MADPASQGRESPCIAWPFFTSSVTAPEEIVRKYEHLDVAGVYAALAYYHANQAEVDAEIVADEAESDRLEAEHLQKRDVA